MAKFSCSVLSTLHWRQFTRGIQNIYIFCIYTQGVSLYLRHNLKSKLIHKIPTRHCKQSHARSYDYSTTPQQNIITWLKEIIISYIFSFNDIVTINRLDLFCTSTPNRAIHVKECSTISTHLIKNCYCTLTYWLTNIQNRTKL